MSAMLLVLSSLLSVLALPGFTIAMNWVEFVCFIVAPIAVIACAIYDMFWTYARNDDAAALHFEKATAKRKLIWIGLIVWALYTVYATLT